MVGSWVVSSILRFSSNGGEVMARLAASAKMLDRSLAGTERQIGANSTAMTRYAAQLAAVRAEQARLARASIVSGAGIGAALGVWGMGAAISDAAKLQTILTSIKNVIGGTTRDMDRFYNASFNLANKYGMSVTEGADLLRTVARGMSGQFGAKEILRMASKVAEFSTVLHATRPDESVEEASKQAIQVAHLFRQYDPAGMTKALDLAVRMAEAMPDSFQRAITQLTYMTPTMKTLGMGDEDAMATMVLMSRFGFGRGKGGTNTRQLLLQMLGPLQLTEHAQGHKQALLRQMGMIDAAGRSMFMRDNKFQYFPALEQLGKWAHGKRRDDVVREMQSAFGTQGANIANLAIDPKFLQAMKDVARFMTPGGGSVSQAGQAARIMDTVTKQWNRVTANFGAVWTELAYPWLDSLTRTLRSLGDGLHGFQAWLHSHRDAEKMIGAGFAGGTALLSGVAVAGAVNMARRVLGFGGGGGGAEVLASVAGGRSGMVRAIGEGLAATATFAPVRSTFSKLFAFSPGGKGFIAQGASALTRPSVITDMAAGFRALPGMRQILTVVDHLGGTSKFAAGAMNVVVRLFGFGVENLLKLGLRAIPFVGDLLLISDAFNFFKNHPKEIGVWVARVVFYMKSLIPQTIATVGGWVPIILGAFGKMFAGIWDMLLHPGKIYGAYQEAHRAYNNMMWQQGHAQAVNAVRALTAHNAENQRRYLENQRTHGFDSDRKRRTYGAQDASGNTFHFNAPITVNGVKDGPAFVSFLGGLRLTQGMPRHQTGPDIPLALTISTGAHA